ncbi:MAG: UbiA family prenyltransferase [Thermoplasmata archaeon]
MWKKMGKLREYLVLSRIQTASVTALAPVIGILSTGKATIETCILYFVIGILIHIYGFVLNEWADYIYDCKAEYLKSKPLVAGTISRNSALALALFSMVVAYILVVVTTKNIISLPLMLISIICGGLYDLKGKKIIGSDFVLAAWAFTFTLAAGFSVLPNENFFTIPTMLYIVALLGSIQVLFNNSVEGGIKDLEQDRNSGARTWMIFLGSKVVNNELMLSPSSIIFAYCVKCFYFLIVISPALFGIVEFSEFDLYSYSLLVLLFASVMFLSMPKFIFVTKYDREKLKKIFSIHEVSTFFLIPTVIIPIIGLGYALTLMLIPLAWYVVTNILLYGKALQPQV